MKTAKEKMLAALRAQNPRMLADATVLYAIEQPETIEGIRLALRFAPILARHVETLQQLPPRRRRARLQALWDLHVTPAFPAEVTEKNLWARKAAIDAAMKALAEKPVAKKA